MSDLRLVPVAGPAIEVVKDENVVGRDPGCDLVVTDGSVSRRHARLERRGPGWWVVDQGSANGTYVNSLRVAEQELRHGQELRFGALAYRVQITDAEATVAVPALADDSATQMAPAVPPPVAPPPPTGPPPIPARPTAPPAAPPAGGATGPAATRPRPLGAPVSPVPQMPAGPPPARKGRSPLFWVGAGCCGCVLVFVLLIAVIGGGAMVATRPAANAAHGWLGEMRGGRTDEAQAALSSDYRARLSSEQLQALAETIQRSHDATFYQRSIENDRAVLRGWLTVDGGRQPITIRLVREAGAWKIDDVELGVE